VVNGQFQSNLLKMRSASSSNELGDKLRALLYESILNLILIEIGFYSLWAETTGCSSTELAEVLWFFAYFLQF
jgi:hypothetical protein